MTGIVAIDVGGTHVRFAMAEVEAGQVLGLGDAVTLRTSAHEGLQSAWRAFADAVGRPPPRDVAIAFAGPVRGEALKLVNNDWVIRPDEIRSTLGAQRFTIVNDFGAVAHAVARLGEAHFAHLCGPDRPLAGAGVTSIVGPGTGLGIALLVRRGGGYEVVETEGGHFDFAPLDPVEDRILARLRARFGRVSAERIVSGPGLANLHEALAAIDGQKAAPGDPKALLQAALSGGDPIAARALDRFCLSLGAVAGDVALAQGADSVAIAGGLGLRLADRLPASGFAGRFAAKGRFEAHMREIPVRIVTHPQPGLYGAAVAFAREHGV